MRTFSIAMDTIRDELYQTMTYAMKAEHIEGYVDGRAAVVQAVYKILNTEQFQYPIYSFSYGVELSKLVGKEPLYIQSELKRIVTEALQQDGRIKAVSGFSFNFEGDVCKCSFNVESIYGTIMTGLEVSI